MDDLEDIRKVLLNHKITIDEDELQNSVVKMQHLTELWLDSFEKEIFEGKTLRELLENTIL